MRVLSPILHRMVYPVLASAGYFHSYPSSVISVITYHGVLPSGYRRQPFLDDTLVNAEIFRSQLRLLKEHYNVISPDQFRRWLYKQEELPERAVLLTCDDGLLNVLTDMLPIFQEQRLKCLFFVTGESLVDAPGMLWYIELYLMVMEAREQDKSFVLWKSPIAGIPPHPAQRRVLWLELLKKLSRMDAAERRRFTDEAVEKFGLRPDWRTPYLSDPLRRDRFQLLGVPELKKLTDAEMTVGAHSLSHPALVEQPPEMARAEIAQCRQALEKSLGQQVWAMAYPFGDPSSVSHREFTLAQEAGYECAFMNVGGVLNSGSPRFALPRVHVTADMSLSVYEAHISGFHSTVGRRFWRLPRNGAES